MIVQIAVDIDVGELGDDSQSWDVPNMVAKAVAAKLGGGIYLIDAITHKPIRAKVAEVCGIYGEHPQRPE